jgi:2-polyprenyl-3-methyl-5-hydroxy-6-metoxy-1,4-benzoquinol methylase
MLLGNSSCRDHADRLQPSRMATDLLSADLASNSSYVRTLERFAQQEVARAYPRRYRATRRDRRERRAILQALTCVPAGASILDLPCGTGRLTALLVEQGLRVTGADSSAAMVAVARRSWSEVSAVGRVRTASVPFEVQDVMRTGYTDGQFDAVICSRLFHHFTEAATRRRALNELQRICSGPVIVSFFNSFSLSTWQFRWKHWRRGTQPLDRIPIPLSVFEADIHSAGLRMAAQVPVRWGVSPQWYLVLKR